MPSSFHTPFGRRRFLKLSAGLLALTAARIPVDGAARAAPRACPPGWQGHAIIDDEPLGNWAVEQDAGASGALVSVPGLSGLAVRLDWNLGVGSWVQARYLFPQPVDLSLDDIFAITLHGGSAAELRNTVTIMFADASGAFYGYDMPPGEFGINQMDRWLINLAFPKQALWYFWGPKPIDWTHITRFFVTVKRPGEAPGGGSGHLTIDRVQGDTAANWPRQSEFAAPRNHPERATRAISYMLGEQDASTGLFVSWKEEETPEQAAKAWLYDQALVLIALTREGRWQAGTPANSTATAAGRLAGFITARQKPDGHWARGWYSRTGEEFQDDGWVGDQAWWVMALAQYAGRSGASAARVSAERGASWLAARIDASGKLVPSTEGNVDAWWALMATGRLADADKVKAHLLGPAWDPALGYWWRGQGDAVVAMDAATWLSAFARHPTVGRPAQGLAALSFVRRVLAATSADGSICGLDGMGPVTIWNEGIGQYIAAGGEDGPAMLDVLLAQQQPDGSLPASTETWPGHVFGWHTTWRGLAPTAWFYFALTGMPFPLPARVFLPDVRR